MAKIIKEIIIMLLVCLATMLIFAIALYKYIPSKKIVPEIATYVATDEVKDLLADNIDSKSEDEDVKVVYEVTSSDLAGYQTTNAYVPGKANPFSTYVENPEGEPEDPSTTPSGNSGTSTNTEPTKTMPSVYSENTGTK